MSTSAKWTSALMIILLVWNTSACMNTVTKYRTVNVPEVQTKYRTVKKPVEKSVTVPYTEEIQVPQYRIVRPPLINPSDGILTVAFLPFSISTGERAFGSALSLRFEEAVSGHAEVSQKYRIVTQAQIRAVLGKSDISLLLPGDYRKLIGTFELDRLVTGNVRSHKNGTINLLVEVLDAVSKEIRYSENMIAAERGIVQSIVNLFYGVRQFIGNKTETVTKYRTERVVEYVEEEEAYTETVMVTKQEAYQVEELDLLNTLLLLAIIAAASTPKK